MLPLTVPRSNNPRSLLASRTSPVYAQSSSSRSSSVVKARGRRGERLNVLPCQTASSCFPFFTPSLPFLPSSRPPFLPLYRSRSAKASGYRLGLIPPARASAWLECPHPDCRICWSNQSHPSPRLSAQRTRPPSHTLRRTRHLPLRPLLTRTPGSSSSWIATHRPSLLPQLPRSSEIQCRKRRRKKRKRTVSYIQLHGRLLCDFRAVLFAPSGAARAFKYIFSVFNVCGTWTALKTFDIEACLELRTVDTSGGQYLFLFAS